MSDTVQSDVDESRVAPPEPVPNEERRDVFGGESDLSDLEDSDIDPDFHAPEPEPQPRKRKSRAGENPKKTKSRRRRSPVPEEPEVVDPVALKRRELAARIDAMVKSRRSAPRRRRNNDDDLDLIDDDKIAQLRNEMLTAADDDREAINAGAPESEGGAPLAAPAINKLRILDRVLESLRKQVLSEALVENGILEAVGRWLEPLPDGSLPALAIQRSLFEVLGDMPIETSALKSSGLGKVVYFYVKCKRVDAGVQRLANKLVTEWMRPILRRSSAYNEGIERRRREMARLAQQRDQARPRVPSGTSGTQGTHTVGATPFQPESRFARVPEQLTAAFAIAPGGSLASQAQDTIHAHAVAGHAASAKMRSFKKKMLVGQQSQSKI